MAGLLRFTHVLAVFLLVAVIPAATVASGLSSFWQHYLPHTTMPAAFEKLASPLSVSRVQHYATQLQAGNLQASRNGEFCSSARIYCQEAATIVGVQPRVCIPPFFLYSYNLLPCNQGSGSAVGAGSSAVEASSTIFFLQKSLSVGEVMQLPDTSNDLKGLRFLPHALSESLPEISLDNLPKLSRFYGVSKGSDMALDMQNTATYCSFKSEHEVQACLTSAEAMVSFVSEKVGRHAAAISPPATTSQEATVMGLEVVSSKGGKVASCHDMKFPSLLFTCHMTQSSQVMNVALKLADGATANLPAICHMDTSYWSPSHIAFQALNTKPGVSSICHWLPENSFIFMEAAN